MPTPEECKRIIGKLGMKYGVSPKLIIDRLLSADDKKEMISGLLTIEVLEIAMQVWIKAKFPNYAKGETTAIECAWKYLP